MFILWGSWHSIDGDAREVCGEAWEPIKGSSAPPLSPQSHVARGRDTLSGDWRTADGIWWHLDRALGKMWEIVRQNTDISAVSLAHHQHTLS